MGLGNDERVSKMYWALHHWRDRLVTLHDAIPLEYPYTSTQDKGVLGNSARDAVNSWIKRVDRMAGHTTAMRDSTSGYWLFGSNENNYSSFYTEVTNLEGIVVEESDAPEYPETDLFSFTQHLAGGSPVANEANIAAAWWSMWYRIDNLLYPVYRYKDGLFPEAFHEQLYPLMGEMMHRRYELMAGKRKEDVTKEVGIEQAVLSRWNLYLILKGKLDTNYPYNIHKISAAAHKKKVAAYESKLYYQARDLIQTVGKMSLVKVVSLLKQEEKEGWDRKREYEDEHPRKEPEDRILGPKSRTRAELDKILYNSLDKEEVEEAGEEMYNVYHTSCGWEYLRKDRLAEAKIKANLKAKPKAKNKKPVKRTKK